VCAASCSVLHAQIVAVSDSKLSQCGHGGVVCDGTSAFSLTELQQGIIHLPISNSQTPEFVIVNDTGAPVTLLQFSFYGRLAPNAILNCQISGGAALFLRSCNLTGNAAGGDGTPTLHGPIDPPAEFSFIASGGQQGIPSGAFFDLKTAGFAHAGQDNGYLSGSGGGSGPSGPPQQ
jgi:hypothetical protein